MSTLSITIILGLPAVALSAAIALMIWRAFNPKRNKIPGLTASDGQIVNPYVHLVVSIVCLLISVICYWRLAIYSPTSGTSAARLNGHLELLGLALISHGLSIKFFQQFKKFKKGRAKADA